jgi:hypothetical protein
MVINLQTKQGLKLVICPTRNLQSPAITIFHQSIRQILAVMMIFRLAIPQRLHRRCEDDQNPFPALMSMKRLLRLVSLSMTLLLSSPAQILTTENGIASIQLATNALGEKKTSNHMFKRILGIDNSNAHIAANVLFVSMTSNDMPRSTVELSHIRANVGIVLLDMMR